MKIKILTFNILLHSFMLHSSEPTNSRKVTFQDPYDDKYLHCRRNPTLQESYLTYLRLCQAWRMIQKTLYQYPCQNNDETIVWECLQKEDLSIKNLYQMFSRACPIDKIDFIKQYHETIRRLSFIFDQKKNEHLAQATLNIERNKIRFAITEEEKNQRAAIAAAFITERKL